MDELLGSVKRMPEGPENSTRPTDVISLQSSVRSDGLRQFCQSLLISDLNSTSFAHYTSVRSEYSEWWHDRQPLVYGTCPGREIGHTTTPACLLQIPGIMRRVEMPKSYGGIPISRVRVNSIYQTRSRAQLSGPAMSKR